ncbi:MAG: cytochrome b N-terminal domain-containing protein [Planctomycetota bacterium]|nr:cytochrome b N-terminal domain-containing protein [Planctomycetota bacterium]
MSTQSKPAGKTAAKPGLLGQLADFLDDRTGYRAVVHEALYERVPGGARWRYVWGSTLVFAFMTQVITGLFLWASYSASAQTAWESVYYIQHEMTGGWLLRGIHHFMAQAMVVLLALHLLQVVIDGAYRAPREVNFWLGLVLMMLVLGMALTGYLLPWDQKGYWATIVATNLAGIVPVVGPSLQQLVIGGNEYGHHTLTRFFAIHAGFLPGALIVMLVVHLALFRKHGLHAKQPITRPDAMFWPDQVLKDAVAMLAVMAVVLGVILMPALKAMLAGEPVDPGHLGAELGAPADPSLPYAAARPEWYFLFLFQFLKVFEGWGATGEFLGAIVVPGLIMGVMFLMPIVGRWNLGHRFNVVFTLAILAGAGLLTALALNEDYYALWVDKAALADAEKLYDETGGDEEKLAAAVGNDAAKVAAIKKQWHTLEKVRHSQAFLDAARQAKLDAARAIELAGRPERIPPAGMLELVRSDPKTQGPLLFAQHCGSCHAHVDPQAPEAATVFTKASAANLFEFGAASWARGLLDPDQVGGPAYFGNTAHKEGDMVSYVTGDMTDADTWSQNQIEAVIAALAAEAGRPDPQAAETLVAEGRKLIADGDRCGGCHRFGDNEMDLGTAPDLTGWGSREWLVGIINDPSHERFYGDTNDRMPSFGMAKEGAAAMLTPQQVGLIADWLRETWYRPATPVAAH